MNITISGVTDCTNEYSGGLFDEDDESFAESAYSEMIGRQITHSTEDEVHAPVRRSRANLADSKKRSNIESISARYSTQETDRRYSEDLNAMDKKYSSASLSKTPDRKARMTKEDQNEMHAKSISDNLDALLKRAESMNSKIVKPIAYTSPANVSLSRRAQSLKSSGNTDRFSSPLNRPMETRSFIESSLNEENQSHLMAILKRKRRQKEAAMQKAGISSDEARFHLSTAMGKKLPAVAEDKPTWTEISSLTVPGRSSRKRKGNSDRSARKEKPAPKKEAPKIVPKPVAPVAEVPVLSDRSLKELATRKCQEVFHSVHKDEDGYIDSISFREASLALDLNWTLQLSEERFNSLDLCGMGCLCYEEFENGIIDEVIGAVRTARSTSSAVNQQKAEFIINSTTKMKQKESPMSRDSSLSSLGSGRGQRKEKQPSETLYQKSKRTTQATDPEVNVQKTAKQRVQEAFDSTPKVDRIYVDLHGFKRLVKTLGLTWSRDEITIQFNDLDYLGEDQLDFETLESGILKAVEDQFNKVTGPKGAEVLTSPNEDAEYGRTSEGQWVRQGDVLHRENASVKAKNPSDHPQPTHETKVSVEEFHSVVQEQIPIERRSVTFSRDTFGNEPVEVCVPEVLRDLYAGGEETHSRTKLPMTKKMVENGKEFVLELEKGRMSKLACLGFFVQGLQGNPNSKEIITEVAALAERYCLLERDTKLYHIHESLFIIISLEQNYSSLEAWQGRVIKFIKTRCIRDYGLLNLKAFAVSYVKGEMFASFVDRMIDGLQPDSNWLAEDTRKQLDELLYKVVAERNMFQEHCTTICKADGEYKWTEEAVSQCVMKLLKRGASFNFVDDVGNDVVMHTAKRGHNLILQTLISSGKSPDTNLLNRDGMCLLMVALYHKRVDDDNLMALVTNYDHPYTAEDSRKRTCLTHCLNLGKVKIAQEMISRGARNVCEELVKACTEDDVNAVREFFRSGLQMTIRITGHGTTLGCCAAQSGATGILKFLLRLRSDLGVDNQGASALHYATIFNKGRAVRLLVDGGLSVNAQDNNGETPLLCAVGQGLAEVVDLLIKNGANVNLADNAKTTPVMRAASYGYTEVVHSLLQSGCDTQVRDENGKTAYELAKGQHHNDIAQLISVVE